MKILSVLFFLSVLTPYLSAQKGFFIEFAPAYQFGLGSHMNNGLGANSYLHGDWYYSNFTNEFILTSRSKALKASTGVAVGGTLGYRFTPHISAHLLAEYTFSTEQQFALTDNTGLLVQQKLEETYSGGVFSITPALKFTAATQFVNPYMSFGAYIGFPNLTRSINTTTQSGGMSQVALQTWELSSNAVLGIRSSLGVDIHIHNDTELFAEFNFAYADFRPNAARMTAYTENGTDRLATLTIAETRIQYQDNADISYFVNGSNQLEPSVDENRPTQAVKQSIPMSFLGFRVGYRYFLQQPVY